MKKILTFGVFDYFHYGHLKLLARTKALGDYLIVAVQRSEEIHKTKPEAKILYSTQQRIEIIKSIRYVDEVVPYSQVDDDIKNIDFDVFVRGEDQVHAGFERAAKWCQENGKQVLTLTRTPNISSTQIKSEVGKD